MNYALNKLWRSVKDYQMTAGGHMVVNMLMTSMMLKAFHELNIGMCID